MRKSFKLLMLLCLIVVMGLIFTACSGGSGEDDYTIGIVQIVEHPSLDTIRESFIAQLETDGYVDGENIEIDYQNAQNEQTNLNTITKKFVNNDYDLIMAIATPSAQAAVGATDDIPIVFAACTDPLGSNLVADMESPGGNVTGTSDAVSAEMIMNLAEDITPGFKKIGALYNSSETNSISVVDDLEEYADANGMEVIRGTVSSSSEVQQVTNSLIGKIDILFSPIDNTIASAMAIVARTANDAEIPFYVGADSMVKDGALATYGINYTILGQETGDMAVEIIEGKNPGEMSVRTMSDMDIYINKTTAEKIGIEIPDSIMEDAAEIFE
ncbi:MAG: ABC transporter substrate binding protein [Halanaerobiales bacterium]